MDSVRNTDSHVASRPILARVGQCESDRRRSRGRAIKARKSGHCAVHYAVAEGRGIEDVKSIRAAVNVTLGVVLAVVACRKIPGAGASRVNLSRAQTVVRLSAYSKGHGPRDGRRPGVGYSRQGNQQAVVVLRERPHGIL